MSASAPRSLTTSSTANNTLTEVRADLFERQRTNQPRIRVQVGTDHTDPAAVLARREEALYARITGEKPSDAARPFVGDRLVDHAGAILTMRGEFVRGMHAEEILTRAAQHTISDFPQLLTGVGNRMLMPAYTAAQSPIKALCRQATHPDFRPATKLRISGTPKLEKVSESGEITSVTRGESKESYALDTYGSIFALSRKAVVNDDLGAFRDWANVAGRAAAETETDLLITLLTENSGAGPTMDDTHPLFYSGHGNVAAEGHVIFDEGEAYPVALSDARLAMRKQTGLDGVTPINAAGKFLLVPAELETLAEQAVVANIQAQASGDTNPFIGKLVVMVEPRLTDPLAWYVFADPAVLPCLEFAYLSSAQGPQMASRQGWDVLGTEFRVHLDFGAGAIDWRGAYRNEGAEIEA